MQNFQLKINIKYPGVAYDYSNGIFYRLKSVNEVDKRIFADCFGYITYLCCVSHKRIRKKACILAYEIMNNKTLPDTHKLYFKDMDENNLKFWNIGCVTSKQYTTIKDAIYNLKGGIKIIPHKNDVFVYFISYKTKGRIKKKLCHDIISALRVKRIIMLTSNKVLGRYITSK